MTILLIVLPSLVFILFWYPALIGWGRLLERLLNVGRPIDPGLAAGWGLAIWVVVGGWLNLLRLIDVVAIGLLWIIGITAWMVLDRIPISGNTPVAGPDWRSRFSREAAIVASLILAVLLWKALGSQIHGLNPHDDFHAYLVFPERMLQTGFLGPDPFSERRMLSFGGQSWLQVPLLAAFGPNKIALVDPVLGWLVTLGLVAGSLGVRRWYWLAVLIPLLVFSLPEFVDPAINISAQVTGVALLLAIMRTMDERPAALDATMVLVGALGGAALSLKHTLLPPVALLILAAPFLPVEVPIKERLRSGILAFVGLAVALLPWMIDMRMSSGTALFPILGQGTHGIANGMFSVEEFGEEFGRLRLRSLIIQAVQIFSLPQGAALVLLSVAALLKPAEFGNARRPLMLVAAGQFAAAVVIAAVSEFDVLDRRDALPVRYTFAGIQASILFAALLIILRPVPPSASLVPLAPAVLLLAVGMAGGGYWRFSMVQTYYDLNRLKAGKARANINIGQAAIRAAQAAVPAGQPLLTRLDRPYQLDFRRNPIFMADWPCGASPAPGMPCTGTPTALSTYLRNQGIRYVLYSYRNEANYSRAAMSPRLSMNVPGSQAGVGLRTRYTFSFQDLLVEWARQHPPIYDKDGLWVLDFQPVANPGVTKSK